MAKSKNPIREIVVLSGKGGTGKTSLTASFAALVSQVVLADCDVDAADLHLVLPPTVLERYEFVSGNEAVIDPSTCTRCGFCESACQFDAIGEPDGIGYTVDAVRCEGCEVCVRVCPNSAISFPERSCGQWMVSNTRSGPMVHARLYAAAENSGKLVTLVRKEARRIAKETGCETILVDGPPGIGCPVIASLTGATALVLVAEPSVSGRHDMERLGKLAYQFDIPVFVCINKYDIDKEQSAAIEALCARTDGMQYAGHIPYDEQMVKAQIAQLSLVEFSNGGESRKEIERIWEYVWSRI